MFVCVLAVGICFVVFMLYLVRGDVLIVGTFRYYEFELLLVWVWITYLVDLKLLCIVKFVVLIIGFGF